MSLDGNRTFVGLGFGPIQAGLFLYEAFRPGAFGRLVVAEVQPDLVRSIRQAHGHFSVNIAHRDYREVARIGPVEIYDPNSEQDYKILTAALADSSEIATAVPNVQAHTSTCRLSEPGEAILAPRIAG